MITFLIKDAEFAFTLNKSIDLYHLNLDQDILFQLMHQYFSIKEILINKLLFHH